MCANIDIEMNIETLKEIDGLIPLSKKTKHWMIIQVPY